MPVNRITSRITSKSQTTIPQTVRDILGVGPGDVLSYVIEGDRVVIERAKADADLAALGGLLGEWGEKENDVYDGL